MAKGTASIARLGSILLAGVALLSAARPSRADMSVYGLYDLRHSTDPADNARNFPVIELKGFFPQSFGSFLFKTEIDLAGSRNNQSEVYSQLDQSIRLGHATLWGSPISLHLGYSGGLGLFNGAAGGYYVQNAYDAGLEYPSRIAGTYCDFFAAVRYTHVGTKPSYDPMISFWAGRYFLGYRLLIANSLEAWTIPYGIDGRGVQPSGRATSWELESEVWYKVARYLSIGTYIRSTRNVYVLSNRWVVYPSVGVRYAF